MEKEFLTELKKHCNIHGIDIDITWDNEINLIYNGTTFDVQWYEDDGKLEVPIFIVSMSIKGKDYRYDVYPFVDIDFTGDAYNTVNEAVEDVIDIVVNSDDRKKALKIINSFESFIEDISEKDLETLISYIKNNYD